MRRSANVVALLRRSAAAASCSGEHAAAALAGRGALWQAKSMSPTTMTINSKSSSSSSLFLRGFAADAAPEVDQEVFYPAQSAFVGCQAPRFTAPAFVDGEIKSVSLDDYLRAGKYVVMAFYPKDYTYVCPTEIIAFSDRCKEFEEAGAQIVVASHDSCEVHGSWCNLARSKGGLGKITVPMIGDTKKVISAAYGCLHEESGLALRGLYIISPDGVLHHSTINNFPIGRSVDEALRTLKAIKFVAEHGEVCPAGWTEGEPTIKPGLQESKEYFSTLSDDSPEDAESSLAPTLRAVTSRAELDALLNGDSKSSSAVVLDVLAPWCGKCRSLAPFVEELQKQHPGVTFAKLDSDANKALSEELGVTVLPTFKIFKGGKEVSSIVGYKKKLLADAVAKVASS